MYQNNCYCGLIGVSEHAQDTIMSMRTLGARPGCAIVHNMPKCVSEHWGLVADVRVYTIHHNVYENIGGSSGMCQRTQYAIMCIRTLRARRRCASLNNTP